MHKIKVIPYSDDKIAVNIDLNNGDFSLFELFCEKFTRATLKGQLCDTFGIIIDDYEIIRQTANETLVLIGDWDGQIKQDKVLSRTMWISLSKATKELSGGDFEAVMALKSEYCSILTKNYQKIGIAKQEECQRLGLRHAKVSLILKKDDKIAFLYENNALKLPMTINFLAEDPVISGYRVLKNKFNIATELKKHHMHKIIPGNNNFFNILTGNLDESLTFDDSSFKNNMVLLKKSEIFDAMNNDSTTFCENSALILRKCL